MCIHKLGRWRANWVIHVMQTEIDYFSRKCILLAFQLPDVLCRVQYFIAMCVIRQKVIILKMWNEKKLLVRILVCAMQKWKMFYMHGNGILRMCTWIRSLFSYHCHLYYNFSTVRSYTCNGCHAIIKMHFRKKLRKRSHQWKYWFFEQKIIWIIYEFHQILI